MPKTHSHSLETTPKDQPHLRQLRSGPAFRCAIAETQGKRPTHEDAYSFACEQSSAYFWVLDGHNGAEAAQFGSKALAEFGDTIKNNKLPSDSRIQQGFKTVDNQLRKHLKENHSELKSGSTVTGALIAQQKDGSYTAKLVNCGDSRGIIIKAPEDGDDLLGGNTILETVDHKPGVPSEKSRILAAGGTISGKKNPRIEGRLSVSRGMGDFVFKADRTRSAAEQKVSCVPDIYEASGLRAGTCVLLACDGFWGTMTSQHAAKMVRNWLRSDPQADLKDVAGDLIRTSISLGSCDNVTVLLVNLSPQSGGPPACTKIMIEMAQAANDVVNLPQVPVVPHDVLAVR